jgi:hypothetical protein
VLTDNALSAAVPTALAEAASRSALAFAVRGAALGMIPTSVLALTEGVLRAMFMNKLKIVAVVSISLGLIVGAGALSYSKLTAEPPDTGTATVKGSQEGPQKTDEGARRMQRLLEARLAAAKDEWNARMQEFLAGRATLDVLVDASTHLALSQRELSDRKADQLATYEAHFQLMKDVQEIAEARFNAGRMAPAELAQARYQRLTAEIELERAKAKYGPGAGAGEKTKALFEGIKRPKDLALPKK